MTDTITLNYTPRACFQEAHRVISLRSTREMHIGASRRLGKTVFASAVAVMRAITRTSDVAFVAPSLTQALNVGWNNVLDRIRHLPGVEIKKGEALIRLPAADGGTSTIRFFAGVDDGSASGVRGYGFDLVIVDEVASIGADVYVNSILPTLTGRTDPQLITIGTFRGVDLMYQLHEDADPSQGAHSIILPASTSGVHDPAELAAIAKKMGGWGSSGFQREYEANRYVTDDQAFIDQAYVREAQARTLSERTRREYRDAYPIIVSCDPAPTSDRTIIVVRCGPAVLDYAKLQGPTVNEVAYRLLAMCREHDADALFIDRGAGGQGPAIIDICTNLGLLVHGVDFGGRASDPEAFANVRAEIINRVKDWVERPDAVLPPGEDILREMSVVRYEVNASNRLQIEGKKSIRKRLKMSTDFLDALAAGFAASVTPRSFYDRNNSVMVEPRAPDGSRYSSDFDGLRQRRRNFLVMDEIYEPYDD
ncbi:MAG: terminase large subunit domain-containing protein [Pseudomonadota bacterium]|uniref:terminase large subunit domain-containing protein n=1 Tax=Roseovarius salincola TaxID=2978479 RepID=UPI0022A87150|nr:terminase family protein [Roseovarius sp. EGI FJ00037]MCZ0813303.1 terminase family protein [Roseovarius sp. EGI FJ00037]